MTAPQFEALKARALAREPLPPLTDLTPEQWAEFAAFCREKAGWVLRHDDPKVSYRDVDNDPTHS